VAQTRALLSSHGTMRTPALRRLADAAAG
jgi:hypothetical protein